MVSESDMFVREPKLSAPLMTRRKTFKDLDLT